MNISKSIATYRAVARRVSSSYGVSPFRQAFDIWHLSRSPGRIGPGDYYAYRLFAPTLSKQARQEFVGWKAEARLDGLNEPSWRCLGLDKVLMYSLLQSNQIRIAQTKAIYLNGRMRPLAGAAMLDSPDALQAWLREPLNYPFFSKPSASGFGRGAFFATGYDPIQDQIALRDGTFIGVNKFISGFYDHEQLGYLFQKPVEPDARLVSSLGGSVSSLRMIVLYDEQHGPMLHRVFWKLPTGNNMHDNYNGGTTGNLAAAIDHKTGQVVRVINGTGLDVLELEHHPDTGAHLASLAVPDWQKVLDFTFNAALTFPKLRFQQWDIALSKDGPLALEVNLFGTGGCDLTQLLYRKGLLDDTMKAFLAQHGI